MMTGILILSLLWGLAAGFVRRGAQGWYWGCGLPVLCVAAMILFDEFGRPYAGGGASMWPLALWFGGSAAAMGGAAGVGLSRLLKP